MSNMTPLQKSIAEIEAEITALEAYNEQAQIAGLNRAIQILTANLEYEREEIKDAYTQGHFDGNDGCEMDFNDYYTKTYEHERKD